MGARAKKTVIPIRDLLTKAVDRIETLFQQDNPITGVPTGWTDFDEKTSGLQNSDLIIIAGRPSMGKTSFAMNIAENAAIKSSLPTVIFSMEMPGEQLAMRMFSSLGRIDQHKVRTGKLGDEDWPRLTSAVSLLAEAPMFIDDTPALSPNELRARARRIKREHGLGLIIIDYLQLMQVHGTKENRTNEISEISRSLKALAKELEVPVVALSQLNRSLEQRPNKRPVMSDLRESGAIEQDADVIAFIYRDEVYNEDSPDKGIAEIIIAKQRNGPIGTTRLTFIGQYTRFENYIHDIYSDDEPYSPMGTS
jgi:replicative DNA helicase